MVEWLNEKILPKILKFVNTKPITALKNGMIMTMPATIVGSVFLLLANIPIESISNWMQHVGLTPIFNQAYSASFGMIAFIAVLGIPYCWVKENGFDGLPAGIIGLICFILTMDSTISIKNVTIENIIDRTWTGGQGMISAIIIGLVVGGIYSWFLKKDIRIKLPSQVPENVSSSFTALIPAFVLITGALVVYVLFDKVWHTTMVEMIYKLIQTPLQGVTDSFGGALLISFFIPFLWIFGVHGSTLVGGIMQPLLTANSLENQKILETGKALTVANGGHIVTQQFLDQFINLTGAGITIGIVVYMIFFAKSAQYKQLGRIAGVPALFNINEPITFATPIVMNPIMAVPFILVPMVTTVLTYFAMYIGLVPLCSGVIVPWTTPPVISGFLIGGWRTALMQVVVLVVSFFIYLPFIRKMDQMNLEQ